MKNKKLISIYSTKTNQFPNIRSDYNANTALYGESCIDITSPTTKPWELLSLQSVQVKVVKRCQKMSKVVESCQKLSKVDKS